MQLKEYQEKSKRTMPQDRTINELRANMCLGLAGESGEVIDLVKKFLFQGHDIDLFKLEEEIGDVMFYLANLSNLFGVDIEKAIENNYKKLCKRYPEGFSEKASVERTDKN